jgi:D-xylose transport system substrate-binding protein
MRIFALLFLVIFFIGSIFTGCTPRDKIKIGISIGPFHERWENDRDYFIKYLKQMGVNYVVKEAHNDANKQAEQVLDLIKDKIDVLIMIPVNSETAGRVVDRVKSAGIKVVAYDRLIKNCDLDFYLSFDNVKVGELQADFLTRISPSGKYAILGGSPDDYNSLLVRLGQMNILQPLITRGDVEIVLDKSVPRWDPDNAYIIMKNFLSDHTELDAVIASNDGIAQGVCRALEEKGLGGKVIVSGQDAHTDACRRIVQGTQTMTVYKYIQSLASVAVNATIALAKDEVVPFAQSTVNNGQKMVPAILLPSMIQVTKENMQATVIADGYVQESEVYNQY